MSALQKRCFFASATLHAALLSLLFVAPAFMDFEKKEEMIPVITLIPGRLIDEKLAGGGGSPQAAPPANPPVVAPPEPRPVTPPPARVEPPAPTPRVTKVEPVEPEPEPVRPVRRPESEPTPIKPKKPVREEAPSKSETEKPAIERAPRRRPQIAPTFDQPSEAERARVAAQVKAAAEQRERELQAEYADRVRQVGDSLSQNLSAGTSIEQLGPGGEAYAYYGSAIVKLFDEAWTPPSDISASDATVRAKVTIRRDGTVLSRQIMERSRVPAVDASVQKALNRVLKVPPFPEGAKEDQRSFILNFNLKAKRLSR